MANTNEAWRNAAGGPPRKGKQLGWKEEDPATTAGSGTRRTKMFILGVGGAAAVAGIVWLILLLMAGKRPGLIAIAADPTYEASKGVARLDVPYDPYGWHSAQRLLDWAKAVAKDDNTPKALGEKPYWLDDQLDDWADQIGKEANIDPVIVYVALPGGVNRAGDPILYAGRDAASPVREADRPAVQLDKIIDKLDEKAPKKRKLLVLDVGRNLPDPNVGEISSDFSRAVKKKLGAKIAANPTLAVVLAADENQRAWDSADLGMTALSYHLLKTLAQGAGRENMASFRADELFESLRREVEQWSKNNRPTQQVPQMIPPPGEWDEGRKAKYAERKFFKPADGGPPLADFVRPAPMTPPNELREEWRAAADLAGRLPRPATYTPVAWRRYRELLLRFEQATMAGDADAANNLRNPLKATRDEIERGLDLKVDAAGYLLPLAAGTGRPAPAAAGVDAAQRAATLAEAAAKAKAALNGDARTPVEVHLPAMLHHYVKEVLKAEKDEPLRDLWLPAMKARRLAEQAALGVRPGDDGLPYSERVWPDVRAQVRDADVSRRQGEDRMLGPPDQAGTAPAAFQDATRKYQDALATAAALQAPLRLRDEVFADLPFLTRWLTETDDKSFNVAQANDALLKLWRDAYVLADRLDKPLDKVALGAAAKNVAELAQQLKERVDGVVKGPATADAQTNWQSIEYLLLMPPPLVAPEDRLKLVERARGISKKLSETPTEVASNPPSTEEKVVRRLRAASESVSGGWGAWAFPQADLPKPRNDVAATDKGLFDLTPDLTAVLFAHRRRQADFDKYPAGGPAEWAQAELFTRLAVPFAQLPTPEIATVNAWARWRDLLEGQAARVALDHWYNEAGQPYFSTTIAGALLRDADAVNQRLPEARRAKTADAAEAERLAKAPPLKLSGEAEETLRWTTEPDRTFQYAVGPLPYPVPGEGVFNWFSTEPTLLAVDGPPRTLIDLTGAGGARPVSVKAGPKIEDAANETRVAQIRAAGYFRGQRGGLAAGTTVRVNRKPDLVVSEVRPTRDGVLAVRADKDFDPGAVSILLDFSGSMTNDWAGGKSKKVQIVEILRELLRDLPRKTRLSIRVFYNNETLSGANPVSKRVFPPDRVDNANYPEVPRDASAIIDAIAALPASGATPLVPTMEAAIRDFRDDAGNDYQGVRTLIVLTDGADTTKQEEVFTKKELEDGAVVAAKMSDEQRAQLVKLVQADVSRRFAREDVSIQMVIFGADDKEEKLGEEMFKKVEEFETPGRVYRAKGRADLKAEIEAALRPKPRLVRGGATIPPDKARGVNIPASGLPITRTDQAAGEISWRGYVVPDLANKYELRYFRSKQEVVFKSGDALCVRMGKAANGDVKFRREIYYKEVDPAAAAGRVDANHPRWFLSAPEYGWRNATTNFLLATLALEDRPSAEVSAAGDWPAVVEVAQVRPDFVWWEVARRGPAGEERFPGTVYVHNLQGQRAPAWRLAADNGRGLEGLTDAEFLARGWAAGKGETPTIDAGLAKPTGAELRAGYVRPLPGGGVLRARIEDLPFVPDPSVNPRLPDEAVGGPRRCLVVRVDDKAGRRLQAKLPRFETAVAEHRYFYDKDDKAPLRPKVAGYTAVFGPISDDALARIAEVEITVVNVTDLLDEAASRVKPVFVDLKRPTSTPADLPVVEPQK